MQKTAPPPVSACRLTEITEEQALATGELIASVWPRPDRGPVERADQLKRVGREYAGPDHSAPVTFIVWDGDRVVAHALTFLRTIECDGRRRAAMALAMVAADSTQRGRGLGAAVVRAAFDRVDSGAFEVALFQTSLPVRSFYEKLGAGLIENPIIDSTNADDPQANPFWDDIVMRYPASAPWPTGFIDLIGPGY